MLCTNATPRSRSSALSSRSAGRAPASITCRSDRQLLYFSLNFSRVLTYLLYFVCTYTFCGFKIHSNISEYTAKQNDRNLNEKRCVKARLTYRSQGFGPQANGNREGLIVCIGNIQFWTLHFVQVPLPDGLHKLPFSHPAPYPSCLKRCRDARNDAVFVN